MASIKEILESIEVIETNITGNFNVSQLIQLDPSNTDPNALFWCNDKNIGNLEAVACGVVIASEQIKYIKLQPALKYICVKTPRRAFATIIKKHFDKSARIPSISKKATIHPDTKLGNGIFIGDNVVIEENCTIGDNTVILHNTVIHANTIIGSSVTIGCNNTIGGLGFGYEKNEEGSYELVSHIGNVVIEDFVEIGNNTCIDRAVMGSTKIGKNSKIDNLVHVAHGVCIGQNSLIIAHAMIGGSANIGANTWVAPGALIINKGIIGSDALIGMGAVVVKPVEDHTVVAGNPAKFLKNI